MNSQFSSSCRQLRSRRACCTIIHADDQPAAVEKPHVLLDKSPRVVAYQLKRLSNAQLLLVDRNTSDAEIQAGL